MTPYFYAGGERHSLEPAGDWLAIDTRVTVNSKFENDVAALRVGSKLPGGIILVERKDCADSLRVHLETLGAIRSAYRSGNAVVVLMPEVRVEFDAGQHDNAVRAVNNSQVPTEITEDAPDRLALRPHSGSGEDALNLANYIYEHAKPAASSVRMLQVVPKPLRQS